MANLDRMKKHTKLATLVYTLALSAVWVGLQGCVMVGGTSRGGFFIWPGSLGLLLLIVLGALLLRRR